MSHFDPSEAISSEFGIFGIPTHEDSAKLHLIPVPWEVTTSYGKGASLGPEVIRQASEQVDLFDIETGKAYEAGYFMQEIPDFLLQQNKIMKAKAQEVIKMKTNRDGNLALQEKLIKEVNSACEQMTDWVYKQAKAILAKGKLIGLVGGDHSTPLGVIRALSEHHNGEFGIIHIDAHADLRCAYQGFTQSHASIMYNVMTSDFKPKKLVQVGIRDFCEEENDFINNHPKTIKTFFDLQNKRRLLQGESWSTLVEDMIKELPKKVYISFDIDGLNPALCPNTGTPVAGGLSLDEVFYLFHSLADSGRQIIGFDVNEVSPGESGESEWDGNVGARILYKLCGWSILTNK